MNFLLLRSSLRYLLRHPWQVGLAVLGVALGVAVVVSVDLAATSARRAFSLSAEAVTGRATHRITGSTSLFDDSVYSALRVREGVRASAPVLEEFVGVPDHPGRAFRLLGVDPFAEAPFRPFLRRSGAGRGPTLLSMQRAAALEASVARSLGLAVGDTLAVSVGGRREPVVLALLIEPADERTRRALENVLVMDIAGAQEVLGKPGMLSGIDLVIPDGEPGRRLLERLRAALPPGVSVVRSAVRSESIAGMTRAFDVNLTALSLLALVVGMFLIYNTMTFSVVQRRPFIGRLRAVGVTRSEIFRIVLGEAAAIGVVGTLLGSALGVLLGRVLLGLVTQTINDLYYVVSVRDIALDPLVLLKGVALGVAASLLAALAPAHEATRSSPRSVFSRSATEVAVRSRAPRLALWGCLVLAAGGVLLIATGSMAVSYGGLLLVLLGCALTVPQLTVWGAGVLTRPAGALLGSTGRMAARGIVATLGRTSVAVAALMIAISATIGVGVMVDSFRQTVARWLDMTLSADVYISSPGLIARRNDVTLPPDLMRRLAAVDGAEDLNTVRAGLSTYEGRPFELVATRLTARSENRFLLKEYVPEPWRMFRTQQAVFVSEPFSRRFAAEVGDTLLLGTDRGRQPFAVAGIYQDFATDIGAVLIDADLHARFWSATDVTGMSLFAADGVPVDTLIARLRAVAASAGQPLLIRSNRVLRETSLEVFDRTFAVTSVLRLLTIVVAFVGVLSSLMALQLERAREIGVLRATGMTPRQVWQLVTVQTGMMGLLAGVCAVPVGFLLALVLIYVINLRSFGWTLEFAPTVAIPLEAVVLAILAALLAGAYPAWKMSRISPSLALRDE